MLSSPEFWVAVAFVLFFVFFGAKIYRALTGQLDARSERIRQELEEAVRLREEAQNLLAQYQRKQREAAAEAEAIITHAREEAARISEEAKTHIADQLARREQLAKDKIGQAEARALDEIQSLTVDIAMSATAHAIENTVDEKRGARLINDAIKGLGKQLN